MAAAAAGPRFAVAVLAGALVLLASLVNLLRHNLYPLLSAEVGLVALGILLIAALAASLYRAMGALGRALLDGLLVFLAVDLNADSLIAAAAAGAAAIALGLALRRSLLPFIATMAGFVLAASLAGIGRGQAPPPPAAAGPPAAVPDRPAILHLILDAHIGIEGLAGGDRARAAIGRDLSRFYLSRGFRLYGRGYSQHFHTVNAIPHMLNFGAPPPSPEPPREGARLAANSWFSALAGRGYQIHVRQSEFLDHCGHPAVVRCAGYSSPSLRALAASPLSAPDRAGLIATRFALLSGAMAGLSKVYEAGAARLGAPNLGTSLGGRVSMINALAAFDALIADLRGARPGEAYFAHLLLPHYPYGLGPDCRLKEVGRWMVRRSAEPRRAREAAYFDQLRCTTARVDAALAALAASPAGRNAIVVIHGDHGSRITGLDPIAENAGRFGDADMIAGFSTLLAVRLPGRPGGYEDEPVPVAALLAALARSDFAALPEQGAGPRPPLVVLDDAGWVPRRTQPMPAGWSAPGGR